MANAALNVRLVDQNAPKKAGGRKVLIEQLNSDLGTYFFSRLPAPVSLKPLANGLLSIFS